MKTVFVLASIFGALGVALGAFGAHGLKEQLPNQSLAAYETAVKYQMLHVLLLLLIMVLYIIKPMKEFQWAAYLVLAGIVCFSGSIYFLSTKSITQWEWVRIMGPITPIGGLLLIAGWCTLAYAAYQFKLPVLNKIQNLLN